MRSHFGDSRSMIWERPVAFAGCWLRMQIFFVLIRRERYMKRIKSENTAKYLNKSIRTWYIIKFLDEENLYLHVQTVAAVNLQEIKPVNR